jgi:hypothetical protein
MEYGDQDLPSSIPKPERRTGTREMELGERIWVVYSYPKGVLACGGLISTWQKEGGAGQQTVGPFLVLKPAAVASQPTIRDISCTNAFVSRAFAVLARNWESLA